MTDTKSKQAGSILRVQQTSPSSLLFHRNILISRTNRIAAWRALQHFL